MIKYIRYIRHSLRISLNRLESTYPNAQMQIHIYANAFRMHTQNFNKLPKQLTTKVQKLMHNSQLQRIGTATPMKKKNT